MLDPQIRSTMRAEIAWEPFIRFDGRGAPKYDSAKSLLCYPSYQIRMVRTVEGEEVVSSITLYFDGNLEIEQISHQDRITLMDGRTPPIISIHPFYNEQGNVELLEVSL